jgi:hypothetical protein
MTVRLNDDKLFEKGALDFGNSEFELMKTTCCGKFVAYEHEVGHIYYDFYDLQKVCLEFSIDRCPLCSNTSWDFIEIDESEIPLNWRWAC